VNNQKFVSIPHAKWVEQLIYQAALVGLTVIVTEDSSTSKADLLILDTIPVYGTQQRKLSLVVFSNKALCFWY
jgi:putative transposase